MSRSDRLGPRLKKTYVVKPVFHHLAVRFDQLPNDSIGAGGGSVDIQFQYGRDVRQHHRMVCDHA
jgi:hypothetical protein